LSLINISNEADAVPVKNSSKKRHKNFKNKSENLRGKFQKTSQAKTSNSVRGQACRLECRLLRPPLALARRTASTIKSGFIWSSLHHCTSATWRRFHRRHLTHATDFFQAAGFTVRGGVSVMAYFSTFSRSLPLVLIATSPDDFTRMDGSR